MSRAYKQLVYTHAFMHTCSVYVHVCTMFVCAHTYVNTCISVHFHTYTHLWLHIHSYIRICVHTHTHTHTHTRTHTHTQHTHTHTQIQHTHTHNTHAHTNTHMHTQTLTDGFPVHSGDQYNRPEDYGGYEHWCSNEGSTHTVSRQDYRGDQTNSNATVFHTDTSWYRYHYHQQVTKWCTHYQLTYVAYMLHHTTIAANPCRAAARSATHIQRWQARSQITDIRPRARNTA